jgi:hypothetical protein
VQKTADLLFQCLVWSFGESVLTRFVGAGGFHDVSMLIGDLSDFVCDEFSAIVGSDGEGFVSANMLKVNFGFVCVYFEAVTFACLLESVGSSQHAVRARGDFGFLAADSVFLEKSIDQGCGRVFVLQGEQPKLSGGCVNDEQVAVFASSAFDHTFAFGGSVGNHVW